MIEVESIDMQFKVESDVRVTDSMANEIDNELSKEFDSSEICVSSNSGGIYDFTVRFTNDTAKKAPNVLRAAVRRAYEAVQAAREKADELDPYEIRIIYCDNGIQEVQLGSHVPRKITVVGESDYFDVGDEHEKADGLLVYRKVFFPWEEEKD